MTSRLGSRPVSTGRSPGPSGRLGAPRLGANQSRPARHARRIQRREAAVTPPVLSVASDRWVSPTTPAVPVSPPLSTWRRGSGSGSSSTPSSSGTSERQPQRYREATSMRSPPPLPPSGRGAGRRARSRSPATRSPSTPFVSPLSSSSAGRPGPRRGREWGPASSPVRLPASRLLGRRHLRGAVSHDDAARFGSGPSRLPVSGSRRGEAKGRPLREGRRSSSPGSRPAPETR